VCANAQTTCGTSLASDWIPTCGSRAGAKSPAADRQNRGRHSADRARVSLRGGHWQTGGRGVQPASYCSCQRPPPELPPATAAHRQ
jgi:hypothetical protein